MRSKTNRHPLRLAAGSGDESTSGHMPIGVQLMTTSPFRLTRSLHGRSSHPRLAHQSAIGSAERATPSAAAKLMRNPVATARVAPPLQDVDRYPGQFRP